jgi:caa(3)-type oxidase subunit IV
VTDSSTEAAAAALERSQRLYVTVWGWLVALLAAGIAAIFLPVPKALALGLVFSAAVAKAGLVVRNYMHLRSEHLLIYAIAFVPVALFLGLLLALVPDIVFNR